MTCDFIANRSPSVIEKGSTAPAQQADFPRPVNSSAHNIKNSHDYRSARRYFVGSFSSVLLFITVTAKDVRQRRHVALRSLTAGSPARQRVSSSQLRTFSIRQTQWMAAHSSPKMKDVMMPQQTSSCSWKRIGRTRCRSCRLSGGCYRANAFISNSQRRVDAGSTL